MKLFDKMMAQTCEFKSQQAHGEHRSEAFVAVSRQRPRLYTLAEQKTNFERSNSGRHGNATHAQPCLGSLSLSLVDDNNQKKEWERVRERKNILALNPQRW